MIDPLLKKNLASFNASNGWIQRFKNRYQIVKRERTTISKKSLEDMTELVSGYFKTIEEISNEMGEKALFINFDKIGVFFETQKNYTLEISGTKIVGILSSGQENKDVLSLPVLHQIEICFHQYSS